MQNDRIMKKLILSAMLSMAAWMGANAMSFERAQAEALYLTDKMAYELNLNDQQYNDAYEINLDYFLSIDSPSDLHGVYYNHRINDLRCILHDWQYSLLFATDYFLRPLVWRAGHWLFPIYAHYNRGFFYYSYPSVWVSYHGGHSHYYHHSGFYASRRPVWNGGLRGHDMHRPSPGMGGRVGGSRPGGGRGYSFDLGGRRGGGRNGGGMNPGNQGGSGRNGGHSGGGMNPGNQGGNHNGGGHSGGMNPGNQGGSHSGGSMNPGSNRSGSQVSPSIGSQRGSINRGNSFDGSSSRMSGSSRSGSSYGSSRGSSVSHGSSMSGMSRGSSVGGSRGGSSFGGSHSGGMTRGGGGGSSRGGGHSGGGSRGGRR